MEGNATAVSKKKTTGASGLAKKAAKRKSGGSGSTRDYVDLL